MHIQSLPAISNITGPKPDVSSNYRFVPTRPIIERLLESGFTVTNASQGNSQSPFANHMVELEPAGNRDIRIANGDNVRMRVVLFNSHDRSRRFCLHAGAFRSVCCNGMVFGSAYANTLRFQHIGKVGNQNDFIEGVYRLIDDSQKVIGHMQSMAQVYLHPDQQQAFAQEARQLRWDKTSPVELPALLKPRRVEDVGDSLWLTYQRVQEALLKGGMPGRTTHNRVQSIRALTSVQKARKVNTELWDLAMKYLEAA